MRNRGAQRAKWQAFAVLAGLVVWPLLARAGTTMRASLPLNGRPAAGLLLAVDSDWPEGPAYRPVQFTFTCVPPATSDRVARVRISMSNWNRTPMDVEFDVEIPAFSPGVVKVVPVPRYRLTPRVTFDVWVDGVHIEELSDRKAGFGLGNSFFPGMSDMPAMLLVSPLDIGALSFLGAFGSYANMPELFTSATQIPALAAIPAANLFEDWLNYSALDVVYISLADVQLLSSTRPKVWQSIRRWVQVGGNLVVSGIGDDWRGLVTLDKLLSTVDGPTTDSPLGDWSEPDKELYGEPLQGATFAANSARPRVAIENVPDAQANDKPTSAPANSPFVWKDAMLGRVVAISGDPMKIDNVTWRWIFNTLGFDRFKWQTRFGLATYNDNADFDNLLIADVGLPPVRTYRILITVFVICIGPLNYWLLYRSGRLPLLLFTVPASALVVSAALFGYAALADGFQTRLRARSYTELDQRTREAASWARLSYYSGLAPARGLVFPGDTAVVPFEKEIDAYGWGKPRFMRWQGDQHLVRGWLASRTPTQYMTLRAYDSRSELRVAHDAQQETCTVQNMLGTPIRCLMLCAANGELYVGRDIAPAKAARLVHLADEENAERECTKIYEMLRFDAPQAPPDALSNSPGAFFGGRRARYYPSSSVDATQSLLESSLRRVSTNILAREFEPRTYMAIVQRPGEIVVGVDSPLETQSLHVIVGRW